MPVTVEEYKARLAAQLVSIIPTLEQFRTVWVVPPERRTLLEHLPDAGRSAALVRELEDMKEYDLYDVLADLGYGLAPKTRLDRAASFEYKHSAWLGRMPPETASVLRALISQFAKVGTDGLENPAVFQTREVAAAGGLAALKHLGKPAKVLKETKVRMFAA